jgi:hypothetical protein
MESAQPKITRRHRKAKTGRKDTGKGERLFLAGQRFHFPNQGIRSLRGRTAKRALAVSLDRKRAVLSQGGQGRS